MIAAVNTYTRFCVAIVFFFLDKDEFHEIQFAEMFTKCSQIASYHKTITRESHDDVIFDYLVRAAFIDFTIFQLLIFPHVHSRHIVPRF